MRKYGIQKSMKPQGYNKLWLVKKCTCGTVIMTSGRSRSFNKAINQVHTEIKSLAEGK